MTGTAAEIRRSTRGPRPIPPIGTSPATSLPPFTDTVLSNGLRVMLVRRPAVPMAHTRLLIPFAAASARHAARAHLLGTTLFAGTRRTRADDLADDLARVGGTIDVAVTPDRLAIAGTSLIGGLPTFLDVVVTVLTDAAYPDSDVTHQADLLACRVTAARVDQRNLAREALQRHRYGDHPVARERPEAADIVGIDPTELRALHYTAVVPRGAVLIVVGALDLDRTLADIDRATAGWTSRHSAQHLPPIPALPGGDLQVVDHPGAEQSHLMLSAQAVPHTDPRYPALRLASLALDGALAGRLVDRLQAGDGCWHTATTALEFTPDHAAVNATVNVAITTTTARTAPAVRALRDELDRFIAVPPDAAEVDQSRRYAIGARLIDTRSQQHLITTLSELARCGLDIGWLAIERELLEAVSVDDVAAAAETFLDPTRFTGVLLGNATVLATSLSDMDGVRMP